MSNKRPKRLLYSEEAIKAAIKSVREDKCGLRKSARLHGVPPSTLRDRINGKPSHREVERTYLSAEDEKRLVSWLEDSAAKGHPVTKKQILNAAQDIVIEKGKQTPFKDGRPGKKWLIMFMKRHQELFVEELKKHKKKKENNASNQQQSSDKSIPPSSDPTPVVQPCTAPASAFVVQLSQTPQTPVSAAVTSKETCYDDNIDSVVIEEQFPDPPPKPLAPATQLSSSQNFYSSDPPTPVSLSYNDIDPLTALDRLLDVATSLGLDRMVHLRFWHTMNQPSDDPKEQLFTHLYSGLRRTLDYTDDVKLSDHGYVKK